MEELEHSGVKGMKWGVRKTRNAIARISASSANKKLGKIDGSVARRTVGEALSKQVTGDGLSFTKTNIGSAIHAVSRKGLGKKMNKANELNYGANRSINSALARNARTSMKLAKRVASKSGTAKEKAQKNLDAWNAYSKAYSAKAKKTNAETGKTYSSIDKNRIKMDQLNNQKVKAINKSVYGNNKHGDTNQALDAEYKKTQAKVKAAAQWAKGDQAAAIVGLAGYGAGKASRSAVDTAQYVRASAIRKNVKKASKNQSTKYRTIN